jgi:uncharacterized protein YraI
MDNPVLPVDLPMQVGFTPPQGGGGSVNACREYKNEYPNVSSGEGPSLFTTYGKVGESMVLEIADTLTICYDGFTPDSTIREQVIAPDGSVIRTLNFPVDPDINATDYTALPQDQPGTYTVVSETTDGTFETSFEVGRSIATFPSYEYSKIEVIGRGPNQSTPKIDDTEYIFAHNFVANDKIDFYFYKPCRVPNYDTINRFLAAPHGSTFVTSISGQVSADGRGFIQVPDTVADAFGTDSYFAVVARAEHTPTYQSGTNVTTEDYVNHSHGLPISNVEVNGIGGGVDKLVNLQESLPVCPSENVNTYIRVYEEQNEGRFQSIAPDNGLITVRERPSTNSTANDTLESGTQVHCIGIVEGAFALGSNQWAHCPNVGGFIALSLLEPYQPQTSPTPAIEVCLIATVVEVTALSIQASPSINAESLGAINQGNTVNVLCVEPVEAEDRLWVKVREGTIEGWMSSRYLASETDQPQTSPVPNVEVCATAKVIEVTALSIQASPSINAESLGAINQGNTVNVLCVEPVEAEDRLWVKVREGTIEGWMSSRYLR